jgi:hypothetical protein
MSYIYIYATLITHFKVSQEDDFPKNICYKCVAALEQSYNLWKVSTESEAILRNLTSNVKQDLSETSMQHQVCKLHLKQMFTVQHRIRAKL